MTGDNAHPRTQDKALKMQRSKSFLRFFLKIYHLISSKKGEKLGTEVLRISLKHTLSEGAACLIWKVFFELKDRGVSLETHFPWLNNPDEKFTCVALDSLDNGVIRTVAALLILERDISNFGKFGFVGLVCVDPSHRGFGLSARLMESAKIYAKNAALVALLLWTNQPRVYEKVGFVIVGQDLYGNVTQASALTEAPISISDMAGRICLNCEERYGVPAFAKNLIKMGNDCVSVIICKSGNDITLAKWNGDDNAVVSLLKKVLPKSWKISANQDASLIGVLQNQEFNLDLRPATVSMALKISLDAAVRIPYINILERI